MKCSDECLHQAPTDGGAPKPRGDHKPVQQLPQESDHSGPHFGVVRIDCWETESFPALIEPTTWNGWAQPWFEADQIRRIGELMEQDLSEDEHDWIVESNGHFYHYSASYNETEQLCEWTYQGAIWYTMPGWCWYEEQEP